MPAALGILDAHVFLVRQRENLFALKVILIERTGMFFYLLERTGMFFCLLAFASRATRSSPASVIDWLRWRRALHCLLFTLYASSSQPGV
jgi:cytochrome c biogenesis protein CcdA